MYIVIDIDFFLSVRSKIILSRHIQLVLSPHSSFDSTLYEIDTPETVAYFIFPAPLKMNCLEGMLFETHIYSTVTSVAIKVPFDFTYDYPPGLFGMLGSTVSIVDSTTLRTFGRTNSSASFITQEDQCTDEQTVHTSPELAFTFIVGELHDSISDIRCYVRFSTAETFPPTSSPTIVPTMSPTRTPTVTPTFTPSTMPTTTPTTVPTTVPTTTPTANPSVTPTADPTDGPTFSPTVVPTSGPSHTPTTSHHITSH